MNKSEFYAIIGKVFNIEPSDDLNLLEQDNFSSIALMDLISELEERDIELDISTILESETLSDIFESIDN